jgi:hypothetical protein
VPVSLIFGMRLPPGHARGSSPPDGLAEGHRSRRTLLGNGVRLPGLGLWETQARLDIPRLEVSSGLAEVGASAEGPGGCFAVGRVAGEAAMRDADETMAEGTERGVVGIVGDATLVAIGAGAG